MADYVTLMGAEQVQNAGIAMRGAAESMGRAASQIDDATMRHTRALEELVSRFETAAQQFHDAVERLVLDGPGL